MTQKSLYELEFESDEGRLSLAAAAAAGRVGAILEQAFDRSGLSQDDLAKRLSVSKGRVSQVLHGDGNLHVATIARFLTAMDYRLDLDVTGPDGHALARASRRRVESPRWKSDIRVMWIDQGGVQTTELTLQHSERHVLPLLASMECVAGAAAGWTYGGDSVDYQKAANTAAVAEDRQVPSDV